MKRLLPQYVTRRRLLVEAGIPLIGGLLGCGRRQRAALMPTAVPTSAAPPAAAPTPTKPPASTPTAVRTVTPVPAAAPPSGPLADLVLRNGKAITLDGSNTIAQAVAILKGRVQAVGSDEEIARLIGQGTRVIDLRGRAVTPGLNDAHVHLQATALMNSYYQPFLPPEVRSLEEMRAKLAEYVAKTPAGEWILGYYLFVREGRLPTRQDLDPVSPRHPVWIMQQGGHYGSANSLALKLAGITRDTPDPVGGVIERDAQGEPTGAFNNHRAMDLVRQHIPRYTTETARANVVAAQHPFAACGVTSFQDNNVRGLDVVQCYKEAGEQGEMTLRGAVYYTLEWPADLDRALKIQPFQSEMMRFAGFKFLIDGQATMAYCHQPHNGVRWDLPTWDPAMFKKAVRALHDTGLQICVHCGGDAAVDLTLDAYEEAMNANPRRDPRHRIEHGVLCTPEAIRRMKDLGVVVSTQPQFIRVGGTGYAKLFGEGRANRAIPTREWLQAGVVVALGSDAPSTPWYTPQATLAGAVARLDINNQPMGAGQCMTIQEALHAHTLGSAYAEHAEKDKGSIEAGKLADLAVWQEDPYKATLQRLWQIPVDMTLVGGKVIYDSGRIA